MMSADNLVRRWDRVLRSAAPELTPDERHASADAVRRWYRADGCDCLNFVRDADLRLVCVDCGTALEDVQDEPADEPDEDDVGGLRYWQARCARIEAARNSPEAIRARIDDDGEILARAAANPPPPGSLAAMCVASARDRRDREIVKLAEVETSALLTRLQKTAGRRPD